MGRRRTRLNQALELNLYRNGKYFKYKSPVTGKSTSLNVDQARANQIARRANLNLMPDDNQYLDRIYKKIAHAGNRSYDLSKLCDDFETEWLPSKNYKKDVLTNKLNMLRHIRTNIGKTTTSETSVQDISTFLTKNYSHSTTQFNKFRSLIIDLFRYAKSKGEFPSDRDNPGDVVLKKLEGSKTRKRARLSIDEFWQVYHAEETPDWLKRAMLVALYTIQRPADLVRIKKADVDLDDKVIYLSQEKSKDNNNYNEEIHLAIEMGSGLEQVVKACMGDPITSPFLIHYRPLRMSKEVQSKVHWTFVTENLLSKTFSRCRDKAGVQLEIKDRKFRAGFYEIKALGGHLLQRQTDEEHVKQLMGHTKITTTRIYLRGHNTEVQYKPVKAALNLETA